MGDFKQSLKMDFQSGLVVSISGKVALQSERKFQEEIGLGNEIVGNVVSAV